MNDMELQLLPWIKKNIGKKYRVIVHTWDFADVKAVNGKYVQDVGFIIIHQSLFTIHRFRRSPRSMMQDLDVSVRTTYDLQAPEINPTYLASMVRKKLR